MKGRTRNRLWKTELNELAVPNVIMKQRRKTPPVNVACVSEKHDPLLHAVAGQKQKAIAQRRPAERGSGYREPSVRRNAPGADGGINGYPLAVSARYLNVSS
jgi:hypothetical protein